MNTTKIITSPQELINDNNDKMAKQNILNNELLERVENLTESEMKNMTDAVEKVSSVIISLHQKITDSRKCRSDIKTQMDELQILNETLLKNTVISILEGKKTQMKNQIVDNKEKIKPTHEEKKDKIQEEEDNTENKNHFCDRCKVIIKKEEDDKKIIIEKIKVASSLNEAECLELVQKKWPQEAYVKTKVVVGNPLNTKCEELIVFYENTKEESNLLKLIKEKFTEAEEVLEEEKEEGEIPFLENIVNTRKGSRKTRIYFSKVINDSDIRKNLTAFKNKKDRDNKKNIAIAVTTHNYRKLARKYLELDFTEIQEGGIEFYVPRGEFEKKEKTRPEAVIIGTDATTYASTLRQIRATVNPDELGISIKTVKATKDMRMIVVTEEGKAKALQKEIATKIQGVDIKLSSGETKTHLVILDIDASMNDQEVEDKIREQTKVNDAELKSMRMGTRGTQTANVSMPSSSAEKLIQEGTIKIGWTLCRVKLKIDIIRCYNCLKLGHHSDLCRENKTERKCLNCAEVGHLVKNCTNTSYCTTCNSKGHRNDSNRCPTYRRKVQETTSKVLHRRYHKEEKTVEQDRVENMLVEVNYEN